MKQYMIEKGIPYSKKVRKARYPFNSMEIGDSFVADHNAAMAAYGAGYRGKLKFKAAKIDNETYRIWRVE